MCEEIGQVFFNMISKSPHCWNCSSVSKPLKHRAPELINKTDIVYPIQFRPQFRDIRLRHIVPRRQLYDSYICHDCYDQIDIVGKHILRICFNDPDQAHKLRLATCYHVGIPI